MTLKAEVVGDIEARELLEHRLFAAPMVTAEECQKVEHELSIYPAGGP